MICFAIVPHNIWVVVLELAGLKNVKAPDAAQTVMPVMCVARNTCFGLLGDW